MLLDAVLTTKNLEIVRCLLNENIPTLQEICKRVTAYVEKKNKEEEN